LTKFESFEAQPRDFWRSTDPNTFTPLLPFVDGMTYAEPCYGAGDLECGLMDIASCMFASDIDPQVGGIPQRNALYLTKEDLHECDYIITNPPFSWPMLQPLLEHLPTLKPTWLLLPSDFMHNKQSRPYMDNCKYIVSVGRLFFHKAGESTLDIKYKRGTANNCWYLFTNEPQETRFRGWSVK
jgi:hypothetical protein